MKVEGHLAPRYSNCGLISNHSKFKLAAFPVESIPGDSSTSRLLKVFTSVMISNAIQMDAKRFGAEDIFCCGPMHDCAYYQSNTRQSSHRINTLSIRLDFSMLFGNRTSLFGENRDRTTEAMQAAKFQRIA